METTSVASDVGLEHLERVLSSATFRGADRSRTLLRFLVEQTVGGHGERLKEYTVGVEALGRGPTRLWTPVRLADSGVLPNYDVAPDGRRVVALMPAPASVPAQSENHVTVMLHFFDELRRRVGRR